MNFLHLFRLYFVFDFSLSHHPSRKVFSFFLKQHSVFPYTSANLSRLPILREYYLGVCTVAVWVKLLHSRLLLLGLRGLLPFWPQLPLWPQRSMLVPLPLLLREVNFNILNLSFIFFNDSRRRETTMVWKRNKKREEKKKLRIFCIESKYLNQGCQNVACAKGLEK